MDGWMDGWIDGWMDGRTQGRMDGRTDGRTDGWMDGWMDGWIGGYHKYIRCKTYGLPAVWGSSADLILNGECRPVKCQRPIYLKTYEEMFSVTSHRGCKMFAIPGRNVQRTGKDEVKLKVQNYDIYQFCYQQVWYALSSVFDFKQTV
jgi:hypothetical protein